MSDNDLVLIIVLVAFLAGLLGGVKLLPDLATGWAGVLMLWVSRLVAAAGVATLAMNVYSTVKRQSGEDEPSDPIVLASSLAEVLFDAGVLFSLAVGLAVIGPLLVDRSWTRDDAILRRR